MATITISPGGGQGGIQAGLPGGPTIGTNQANNQGSNTVAKTITTDQELETEVGTFAGAGLPAATTTQQQVQQVELLGTQSGQLGTTPVSYTHLTLPTILRV